MVHFVNMRCVCVCRGSMIYHQGMDQDPAVALMSLM